MNYFLVLANQVDIQMLIINTKSKINTETNNINKSRGLEASFLINAWGVYYNFYRLP